MDELVKRIDSHFVYEWNEMEDDIMRVYVSSTRKGATETGGKGSANKFLGFIYNPAVPATAGGVAYTVDKTNGYKTAAFYRNRLSESSDPHSW